MDKDKLYLLVETIYKSTLNGSLKWNLRNSIFNSETSHRYEVASPDGVTKFDCEINLSDDLKSLLNVSRYIHISNPNMNKDGIYLYSSDCSYVNLIHQWIYDNHIKPNIKLSDQDKVIDDIIKNIDISEFRDMKINSLLDSNKSNEKLKSKESIFKRLFKLNKK